MIKDQQMPTVLRTWMEEEPAQKPDRSRVVSNVVGQLASTRKPRRRWWPFHRRAVIPPTSDQATDFQPAPALATNGHTPTVTGRTQSMFSPAKAITAGALVFAIGGVLLIAQPFDQQGGSVPGAATDTEVAAPVEFTSKAGYIGHPAEAQTETLPNGIVRDTGEAWQFRFVETSDPRIDGLITSTVSRLTYPGEEGSAFELGLDAYRIVNERGAWQELPTFTAGFPWSVDHDDYVLQRVYVGEGDYEGLSFMADETWTGNGFELHGFIFEGELPVVAEPWSAE